MASIKSVYSYIYKFGYVVAILVTFTMCMNSQKVDNNYDSFNDSLSSQAKDTIAAEIYNCNSKLDSAEINKRNENILKAFSNTVDEILDGDDIDSEFVTEIGYFLYDITSDGIPEFWIAYGTCEANYKIKVFTYDKEQSCKNIWTNNAGHSIFYIGKDYVLQSLAHQGYGLLTKLTYNGNRIIETVIEEVDNLDDNGEFKEDSKSLYEIKEEEVEFNNIYDIDPIRQSLGIK